MTLCEVSVTVRSLNLMLKGCTSFQFEVCVANKIIPVIADEMFVLFEANGGNLAFYFLF